VRATTEVAYKIVSSSMDAKKREIEALPRFMERGRKGNLIREFQDWFLGDEVKKFCAEWVWTEQLQQDACGTFVRLENIPTSMHSLHRSFVRELENLVAGFADQRDSSAEELIGELNDCEDSDLKTFREIFRASFEFEVFLDFVKSQSSKA